MATTKLKLDLQLAKLRNAVVLDDPQMKATLGGYEGGYSGPGGDGRCAFQNGAGGITCTFDALSAEFMSGGGWWCCNCAAASHCANL